MSHSPHLHELLEAYRPGVDRLEDDMWLPLREAVEQNEVLRLRLESVERSDRSIRVAMHDAPLPDGLEERLLAGLMSARSDYELVPTVSGQVAEASVEFAAALPSSPPRYSRRSWGLVAGGILTLAGTVLLALFLRPPHPAQPGVVSTEQLAGELQTWLADEGLHGSRGWSTNFGRSLERSHPIHSAVHVPPTRWRRMPSPNRESVVVYELTTPGGKKGFLFVADTPRTFNVPTLPMKKWSLTGGHVAGAWQRENLLYVLVVDEDGISIDDFVRIPRVA
jgi:hypothetical protein